MPHNLGAKKIIARLRDLDYSEMETPSLQKNLDRYGNSSEKEVAKEIIRLVKHLYADKFYEFEGEKAVLFSKKINHRSNLPV